MKRKREEDKDKDEEEGRNEEEEEEEGGHEEEEDDEDEEEGGNEEEEEEEGGNEEEEEEEGGNEEEEEEERGDEEEDEEERENEEGGGGIAAGFDVDEPDGAAGELPYNKTMEHLNQDAEETETGKQAKDQDSVDGGEEDILAVALQRSYTCGHCSEGIDLEFTFYRCVGHSCWGAFTRQSWIF